MCRLGMFPKENMKLVFSASRKEEGKEMASNPPKQSNLTSVSEMC